MDTPMAMLTVAGEDQVREALLDARGVVIGRSPRCGVVLDSERVSRRHARIFQDPFGRWIVEDLGSGGGVLIGGERIQARAVLPGEKITIGPFVLCLSQQPEQDIRPDPAQSSTSTLVEGPADFQVVRQAATAEAALPRVWLQELNQVCDRLAELHGPAELYPAVCQCLASAPGTAALVVRLPQEPAPLPASPEVLASRIGGEPEAGSPAQPVNLHLSRRVLEAIRSRGEPIMARSVHGAEGEFTLTLEDERAPRAVLCAPVSDRKGVVDALYLDVPFGDTLAEVFEFVQAVARQVRLVRKSLLLSEWRAKRRVLDQQLSLAREIQSKLTPRTLSRVPGLDVALYYKPALWVGGDYCDVWRLRDGRLACAIGDVSGKGLPAAMVMANLQAALRTVASFCSSPSDAMEQVNRHLRQHLPEDMFVTLFLGLLDPGSGLLAYTNAGHIPPLLLGPQSYAEALGEPCNLALGISDDAFTTEVHDLTPGMGLLAVTDGVTEALSGSGKEFGFERLKQSVRSSATCSARQLIQMTLKAVAAFCRSQPQHDDLTVLALTRRSSAA